MGGVGQFGDRSGTWAEAADYWVEEIGKSDHSWGRWALRGAMKAVVLLKPQTG